MKRSNRLVILVGLLLAVVAFVAVIIFLNDRGPDQADAEPTTDTVLVAAEEIGVGTTVTADLVEEREVDLDAVQPGALRDVSQLADRTNLFVIPANSQITESAFGGGTTTGVDISGQLQPGEKAIALQLDPVTGLNFLLQQGDVVDVIMSQDFSPSSVGSTAILRPNDTETVRTVKTILQAKRVLYVSATNIPPPPLLDEDGEPVPGSGTGEGLTNIVVVIAGTNQDAELLKFTQRDANEIGSLTLTLRDGDDEETEQTTGVTLESLFETYGVVLPPIVPELPSGDGDDAAPVE